MDKHLLESKTRGSFLFPFELYHTENRTGNYHVSCHWHPDIEIIHLQKGRIRLTIDGAPVQIGAPAILFINREEIHELHSVTKEILYDASVFPLEFLSFSFMDYCQQKYLLPLIQKKLRFPRLITPEDCCYPDIRNQLILLAEFQETMPQGYQFGIKAALFQILSTLIRTGFLEAAADSASLDPKQLAHMRDILSYIDSHCADKLSLAHMADHFYMTPGSFCRYFKKHFGIGFTEYVNNLRIEKACGLLSGTDIPVMEIGFCCGFENFSYFIRLFKKRMELTPSAYRKASITGQSPAPETEPM